MSILSRLVNIEPFSEKNPLNMTGGHEHIKISCDNIFQDEYDFFGIILQMVDDSDFFCFDSGPIIKTNSQIHTLLRVSFLVIHVTQFFQR